MITCPIIAIIWLNDGSGHNHIEQYDMIFKTTWENTDNCEICNKPWLLLFQLGLTASVMLWLFTFAYSSND